MAVDPLHLGILLLLLSHALVFVATHVPRWSFDGAPTYLTIAIHLATTGAYSVDGSTPTCYRPPLYPFLLSGALKLFGERYVYAMPLVQLSMSVAAGVLTALSCAGLSGSRRAGGVAALLYAGHVFLLLESFTLRETGLIALVFATSAYVIGRIREHHARFTVLGILCGLCYLTRPTGIAALAALGLATLYATLRQRGTPRASWLRAMALSGLAFLVTASPWGYFSVTRFGRVFPSTTCLYGQAMYAGNNPLISLEVYPWIDWDRWTEHLWRPVSGGPAEYLGREDEYLSQALEHMRSHPQETALMAAARVFAFYSPLATPLGYGRAAVVEGRLRLTRYAPRSLLSRLVVGGYVFLLYAGAIGYWWWRKRECTTDVRTLEAFTIALFALFTIIHAASVSETRYRLPLDPLLMIFAAARFESILSARGWLPAARPVESARLL